MKKLLFVLLAITIIACGGGSSAPPAGSVNVEGDIKNDAIAWHIFLPDFMKDAFAADLISTRSTLTVTDPERLSNVSRAVGINVIADVINTSAVKITGYNIDIGIEDEQFLTKEKYSCHVCYPFSGGGSDCEIIWSVNGNNLFETDPAPTLEQCQAGAGTQELCVTNIKAGVDCSSPTYTQEYTAKGSGLQKLSVNNVTVEALSNLVNEVGVQSNSWITGTNKYARFTVYNNQSVQVAQKDYIFNVVP